MKLSEPLWRRIIIEERAALENNRLMEASLRNNKSLRSGELFDQIIDERKRAKSGGNRMY